MESKRIVPDSFYLALAGEIASLFGTDALSLPNGAYIVGTNGLHMAIKMTCWKLGLKDIWDKYDALDWRESDEFDSLAVDLAIDAVHDNKNFIGGTNAYYKALMEKDGVEVWP